ncbi:MAG TPA: AAA family ATPase [Acidimicrobiales bacterium]|nr:AAA family ATPase [Acidimicrobiales bacterium]
MARHPDLQAEQAHIDRAYESLEAMRSAARQLMVSVLDQGRGGTPQSREERDIIVRTALHRLEQLEIGDRPLCFGRIDLAPGEDGDQGAGSSYHIGRLAIAGSDLEPLVVDWRAPVAEPFYRATGREPMGLSRRRHFATEGRQLVGIEDEVFTTPHGGNGEGEPGGLAADGVPSGALLAAMEQSRSGHLRDIVATIQAEQDEIIRAPMTGLLVVQGGPGTGKTVVALHRAAYLLYTYRFPLERQGVLVVGPNQLYLRYIEQVLPSLGESGVGSTTVEGLYAGTRPRAQEAPGLARLKGEARMAQVLAAAVRSRQRPLRHDLEVSFGTAVLRVPAGELAGIVATARRRAGPHNPRRRLVASLVATRLAAQARRARHLVPVPQGGPEEDEADDGLVEELRRLPAVVAALDRMWPRLRPEELLHDLYGAPPLIARAGRAVLDPAEQAALHRPRSSSFEAIPWTRADIPLLDEARSLLGPVRRGEEAPRSYGHIVVDEAQDLSPMQLRMLGRRSLSGSATLVGDMAQATGPHVTGVPGGWEDVARAVAPDRPLRLAQLTINYRTPASVMDLATRVLSVVNPELAPPRSVRAAAAAPTVAEVPSGELGEEVVARVRGELAAVGQGTLAVIAPASLLGSLAASLTGAGLPAERAGSRLEAQVTVVDVEGVKGLEFDSVLVVEPARIVEETGTLRSLYVALTRPTRRLTVLHADPLPTPLAGGG